MSWGTFTIARDEKRVVLSFGSLDPAFRQSRSRQGGTMDEGTRSPTFPPLSPVDILLFHPRLLELFCYNSGSTARARSSRLRVPTVPLPAHCRFTAASSA